MDGKIFAELIQFSWTVCALIFGAQGWIFLKEFGGNRIFRTKHIWISLGAGLNVVSAGSLFVLFDLVLNESLSQSKNFVSDSIKLARFIHTYSLLGAFLLTVIALIVWINTKNQRGATTNVTP